MAGPPRPEKGVTRPFPTRASPRFRALAGSLGYWDAWVGAGRPSVVLKLESTTTESEPSNV